MVVAAYRDRYQITDPAPLGTSLESAAQKIDAARAREALNRALNGASVEQDQEHSRRARTQRTGPLL